MKQVAIVIPVYKTNLKKCETVSLLQTFHVLKNYPLMLVCPECLDISNYHKLSRKEHVELHVERFESCFFKGIEGYNRLLLSFCFYERFANYEYILICQTDAFVFKDELSYWCEKKYDYVGAPLFGNIFDAKLKNSKVGNGGLSLRRTQAYLDFFQGQKNVIKTKNLAKHIELQQKPYTRWLVWVLMVFGWRNRPCSVAKRWMYNEDSFWSILLDNSNYALKKPSVEEALEFAFERFPSECYAMTQKLPFGCHAWEKYQYKDFWSKFIIID